MKHINEKKHYRKYISTFLLVLALIITQAAQAATERSLYQIKGYSKFPQATSVGQAVTVFYTKDSVGYISGLSVSAGQEVFLHVEVPPGVTRAAKSLLHSNAYDGIYTSIFKADGPNQSATIPADFSYDNYNNEPSSAAGNIDFYNGAVNGVGAGTFGTLAIKNTRSSTLRLYTFQIIYVIGPEQQDLDNYNAWVASKEGVVGTSPPATTVVSAPVDVYTPTTSPNTGFGDGGDAVTIDTSKPSNITNSADCPLAFLGIPCVTTQKEPQEEEPAAPAAEFKGQSFISGKNAVFERLLILLFKNNGVDINKVEGFKVVDNVFEIPGTDGISTKFAIDLDKIPETMDDIQEDSVTWALSSVEGIDNEDVLVLLFEVGENIVKVELQPVVHQQDDLVDLIKKMDGVFKVYSEDGWLFVLLDNGYSLSLHMDLSHLPVRDQRVANNELDSDLPVNYGYESNDVNGDGVVDIIVIHNGIAQLMLIKPNH